jgi:hypothetical protein
MRKSGALCLPFLAIACFLTVQPARACDIQLAAGESIQAAIDTALGGEVICLDPGLYSPAATIVVDKPLTFRGPQAGIDPRPSASSVREIGNPATEAIVDGAGLSSIFSIRASDVVLEGLEVRNGSGDLIASVFAIPTAGSIIRYNIIHDSSGDEGIQLRKTAFAQISYNHVFATAGDGINVCCGSSQAAIRFNEVHDIYSTNAAIYLYDDAVPATDLDAIISDNLVYGVFVNDGIKLGDAAGADVHLSGGGILNNVIHDTAQDCITVFTGDVLVDGNECFGSLSENGGIFVDYPVDTVLITSNDIHDNGAPDDGRTTYGIRVGKDAFPVNVTVNFNSLRRNEEGLIYVFPVDAPPLDATNNYWGSSTGPGGVGSGLGDSVSENVLFEPFLTACTLGSCPVGGGQAFILTIMEIQSVIDDPATPAEVAKKLNEKALEKVKKAFEEFLKGHPHHVADELKGAIEELEKIFEDLDFDTMALQANVADLAIGQLADLNERVSSITGAGDQDLQFSETALGDAVTAFFAGDYRQAALLARIGAEEVKSPDYLGDFCSGPASASYQGFVCEIQASRSEVLDLVIDDEDSDSDTKRLKEAGEKLAEGLEKLAVVAVKDAVKKVREAAEKLSDVMAFDTTPEQELLADNVSALLVDYLADAVASGHDPSGLQEAAQFYSQGESRRLGGNPLGALESYQKAAEKASP